MSFDFELRHDDIATLKNRHEVGVTWRFIKNLDEDGEEVRNEDDELPEALAFWTTRTTVYAQGPTSNDWAPIGFIMFDQFEGAETFEALHAAAERIVRDELVRVGIETGATEFRVDENSGDDIGVPFISVVL